MEGLRDGERGRGGLVRLSIATSSGIAETSCPLGAKLRRN